MAIRKVLLPLQTAATAETALTTAIAVAKTWNAHLAVLHVEAGKQSSASDIRPTFDKMMLQSDTAVSEPNAAAGGATATLRWLQVVRPRLSPFRPGLLISPFYTSREQQRGILLGGASCSDSIQGNLF